MIKYLNADKFKELVNNSSWWNFADAGEVLDMIDNFPSKDTLLISEKKKPGPYAYWLDMNNKKLFPNNYVIYPEWERYKCSNCGKEGQGHTNYCNNCGCNMLDTYEKRSD